MAAVVVKEMAGPREHLKFYDKFKNLINRKVIHMRIFFYHNTIIIILHATNNKISM